MAARQAHTCSLGSGGTREVDDVPRVRGGPQLVSKRDRVVTGKRDLRGFHPVSTPRSRRELRPVGCMKRQHTSGENNGRGVNLRLGCPGFRLDVGGRRKYGVEEERGIELIETGGEGRGGWRKRQREEGPKKGGGGRKEEANAARNPGQTTRAGTTWKVGGEGEPWSSLLVPLNSSIRANNSHENIYVKVEREVIQRERNDLTKEREHLEAEKKQSRKFAPSSRKSFRAWTSSSRRIFFPRHLNLRQLWMRPRRVDPLAQAPATESEPSRITDNGNFLRHQLACASASGHRCAPSPRENVVPPSANLSGM
ncbi:hypothetical protein B0H11DRAFT_1928124 [Mycena galericulata]|nr:hypothetical protein B0H11DRAFT_1928124 [Mycena galericulata]